MFPVILDYFRKQEFNIKRFTKDELSELREEAVYYEVLPLENILGEETKDIKYIDMEVSSFYMQENLIVGQTTPDVLLDKNLQTGVCTNSPGKMILELNKLAIINQIEIGGFTGKSDWAYDGGYGSGAIISTSTDKVSWKNVGSVPNGFGTTIIKFSVTQSSAKWIKLEGTSWLGIGYLKLS